VSREEKRAETAVWQMPLRILSVIIISRERGFPGRFAKIVLAAVLSEPAGGAGGFENQDARVVQTRLFAFYFE